MYHLKGIAEGITNITSMINVSKDENEFVEAIKLLQKRLGLVENETNDKDLEIQFNYNKCSTKEKEIFKMYAKQFTVINKLLNDFADEPCVCCE